MTTTPPAAAQLKACEPRVELFAFTVEGRTFTHNEKRWSVCTNRHRATNGDYWGWIEGPDDQNVTWSGSKSEKVCGLAVAEHNRWLDAQEPPRLKLVRLTREMHSKQKAVDELRERFSRELAVLETLEAEVAMLQIQVSP